MGILIIGILSTLFLLWFAIKFKAVKPAIGNFILIGIILAIIYGIGSDIVGDNHTKIVYESLNIVSLQSENSAELHASFILGTGNLNGYTQRNYVTYGKFDKGLKAIEFRKDKMYLKETNAKTPQIEKYWIKKIYLPYKSFWFGDKTKSNSYGWFINKDANQIIVPLNTIIRTFNAN